MSEPHAGADEELCRFIVMATVGSHARPFFVMAKDATAAYIKVLQVARNLEHPDIRLTCYVIGASEIAPVMPEIKDVAWFYYREASSSERPAWPYSDEEMRAEFESAWKLHGVETGSED